MTQTRSSSRLTWVLVGAFAVAFGVAVLYYVVTYFCYQQKVPAIDRLARDIRQAQELLSARKPDEALLKCTEAIRQLPEDADPQLRGYAKRIQGTCHTYLARTGDKETHLTAAIAAFKEALAACPADQFPLSHAATQLNLGGAYRDMGSCRQSKECLHKALQAFEVTLEVYTSDEYPLQHARTLNDLGMVYSAMAGYGFGEDSAVKATHAYAKALELLPADVYPVLHSRILSNHEAAQRLLE